MEGTMERIENSKSFAIPYILKFISLAVVLVLIGVLGVTPAFARATTVKDNVRQPVDFVVFVPCAADGVGEYVTLSGTLHSLFVTTLDANGGFLTKYHNQPQGISGIGQTTGDKYQSTGVTQGTFTGNVGSQQTYVNNFKIIGQKPGNNYLIHETVHVTVNANGTVTANVSNFSAECK